MTGNTFISRRIFIVSILGAGTATATLLPDVGHAQMDQVRASMAALKTKTAKLGPPKIEGTDPVAGEDVLALYFGPDQDEQLLRSGG
jgi:hypothetical protein